MALLLWLLLWLLRLWLLRPLRRLLRLWLLLRLRQRLDGQQRRKARRRCLGREQPLQRMLEQKRRLHILHRLGGGVGGGVGGRAGVEPAEHHLWALRYARLRQVLHRGTHGGQL